MAPGGGCADVGRVTWDVWCMTRDMQVTGRYCATGSASSCTSGVYESDGCRSNQLRHSVFLTLLQDPRAHHEDSSRVCDGCSAGELILPVYTRST